MSNKNQDLIRKVEEEANRLVKLVMEEADINIAELISEHPRINCKVLHYVGDYKFLNYEGYNNKKRNLFILNRDVEINQGVLNEQVIEQQIYSESKIDTDYRWYFDRDMKKSIERKKEIAEKTRPFNWDFLKKGELQRLYNEEKRLLKEFEVANEIVLDGKKLAIYTGIDKEKLTRFIDTILRPDVLIPSEELETALFNYFIPHYLTLEEFLSYNKKSMENRKLHVANQNIVELILKEKKY